MIKNIWYQIIVDNKVIALFYEENNAINFYKDVLNLLNKRILIIKGNMLAVKNIQEIQTGEILRTNY